MEGTAEKFARGALEMRSSEARAELEALHARARQLESELKEKGVPDSHSAPAAVQQIVGSFWSEHVSAPLAPAEQVGAVTLHLSPEVHDEKMAELIGILQEKGVVEAIKAAQKSGNAHLIDDFHRILVEYVREGLPVKGSTDQNLKKALSMALFEVLLPR